MRNILITIEYSGTNYHGWQIQPNEITVQEVLNKAIFKLSKEEVKTTGSSRTDAGVHALDQKVNLLTKTNLPLKAYVDGLNTFLPNDILVKDAKEVAQDFNARKNAKEKTYRYYIFNSPKKNVLIDRFCFYIGKPLNLNIMEDSLKLLIGTHDFNSFKASDHEGESTVRTISNIKIQEVKKPPFINLENSEGKLFYIEITANGFLKYMVRNIVGLAIDVGKGKVSPKEFNTIFESKDRTKSSPTAKPNGLFLYRVRF